MKKITDLSIVQYKKKHIVNDKRDNMHLKQNNFSKHVDYSNHNTFDMYQ